MQKPITLSQETVAKPITLSRETCKTYYVNWGNCCKIYYVKSRHCCKTYYVKSRNRISRKKKQEVVATTLAYPAHNKYWLAILYKSTGKSHFLRPVVVRESDYVFWLRRKSRNCCKTYYVKSRNCCKTYYVKLRNCCKTYHVKSRNRISRNEKQEVVGTTLAYPAHEKYWLAILYKWTGKSHFLMPVVVRESNYVFWLRRQSRNCRKTYYVKLRNCCKTYFVKSRNWFN